NRFAYRHSIARPQDAFAPTQLSDQGNVIHIPPTVDGCRDRGNESLVAISEGRKGARRRPHQLGPKLILAHSTGRAVGNDSADGVVQSHHTSSAVSLAERL